tara:strand:+ start:3331 stop:4038 length:708 start_codon:yes stop_codon:yes gene_type:complete
MAKEGRHWFHGRDFSDLPENEVAALTIARHLAGLSCDGILGYKDWVAGEKAILKKIGHTYYARSAYVQRASWAIYTTEFMDSLGEMLKGRRVLEVAAGRGLLQQPMRDRGVDWIATDKHPPPRVQGEHSYVMKRSASRALRRIPHDVLFVSWWPYDDPEDVTLGEHLVKTDTPMVAITEGTYGCIGSEAFWKDKRWGAHWKLPSGFSNVPQWDGIHDQTAIILRDGAKVEDYGLC